MKSEHYDQSSCHLTSHLAKLGEITGKTRVLYSELGEITGKTRVLPGGMSTGCIDRRERKKTPPHLNHFSKHTIGFQGVTSSEEWEPILLDPAKYWHDTCTVPLGPYSRVCHIK